MIMRTLAGLLLAACSLPALAGDGYQFHLHVTDAASVFKADPNLHLSAAQLEDAAKRTVLLVDQTRGMQFRWVILNFTKGEAATATSHFEAGLNRRGSVPLASSGFPPSADLAFLPMDDGTIRTRCLRSGCHITVTSAQHASLTVELKRDETRDLPSDADYTVSFAP